MHKLAFTLVLLSLALSSLACAPTHADAKPAPPATLNQPEELGGVRWMRDYDDALARAKKENKPLLVLFTEVPGCSTVRGFANGPLQDPKIIEAIETSFVPVAIYNNIRGGHDERILKKFGEPTWNNPVVRVLNAAEEPLTRRFSGPYKADALLASMVDALERAGDVPAWIELLHRERQARASGTQKATLSMYCFWTGEAKLGAIEGVVGSRTGFSEGREVVEVEYDPARVSYASLLTQAKQSGAATGAISTQASQRAVALQVFGEGKAKHAPQSVVRPSPKDDKKQLGRIDWQSLQLTPAQATRVNAAVGLGKDPTPWLSPAQRERLEAMKR